MRNLTRISLFLVFWSGGLAQNRALQLEPIVARRQVALVIGNGAYTHFATLRNPVNDANAIAQTLRSLKFEVLLATDKDRRGLMRSVDDFVNRLGKGDVGLLYAASHGVQVDGENFIIPTDFEGECEDDVKVDGISINRIEDAMAGKGTQLNILILDACRNNPFHCTRTRSISRGLAAMNPSARGTFIAFAAGPGGVAIDSNPNNPAAVNGLFTESLLQALSVCGWDLSHVFDYTRELVDRASGGRQTPWTNSSVIGTYQFRPESTGCKSSQPPPRPAPGPMVPPQSTSPQGTSPRVAPSPSDVPHGFIGEWSGTYQCQNGGGRADLKISQTNGQLKVVESYQRLLLGVAVPGGNGTIVHQASWNEQAHLLHLKTDAFGGYELDLELSRDGRRLSGTYHHHFNGCVSSQLTKAN